MHLPLMLSVLMAIISTLFKSISSQQSDCACTALQNVGGFSFYCCEGSAGGVAILPNKDDTVAVCISNNGELNDGYRDPRCSTHGYLSTPPVHCPIGSSPPFICTKAAAINDSKLTVLPPLFCCKADQDDQIFVNQTSNGTWECLLRNSPGSFDNTTNTTVYSYTLQPGGGPFLNQLCTTCTNSSDCNMPPYPPLPPPLPSAPPGPPPPRPPFIPLSPWSYRSTMPPPAPSKGATCTKINSLLSVLGVYNILMLFTLVACWMLI